MIVIAVIVFIIAVIICFVFAFIEISSLKSASTAQFSLVIDQYEAAKLNVEYFFRSVKSEVIFCTGEQNPAINKRFHYQDCIQVILQLHVLLFSSLFPPLPQVTTGSDPPMALLCVCTVVMW